MVHFFMQLPIIMNTIHLDNLAHLDINQLVADTLQSDLDFTQPLTDLVYDKTQGNAFFTRQFLESLYREGLLRFAHPPTDDDSISAEVGWHWDIDQIQAKSITDNVVTLMTDNISRLPVEAQTMLKLAACVGGQFDLQTLATIAGNDHRADGREQTLYTFLRPILMALVPAIQLGFILPLDENYRMLLISESDVIETTDFTAGETDTTINSEFKFAHDQIQLAAYSLIDNNERETTHLQIARLLYADYKDRQDLEDHIFEITDQFDQGIALLDDEAERIVVARLNLLAGQAAKHAQPMRQQRPILRRALI